MPPHRQHDNTTSLSQTRLRFRKFFLFFQRMNSKNTVYIQYERQILLFIHGLHTVYDTNNHFIQKKILKMGPMVLFTHLKIVLQIILLPYFSIFNFNFQFPTVSKRNLSYNFCFINMKTTLSLLSPMNKEKVESQKQRAWSASSCSFLSSQSQMRVP